MNITVKRRVGILKGRMIGIEEEEIEEQVGGLRML